MKKLYKFFYHFYHYHI